MHKTTRHLKKEMGQSCTCHLSTENRSRYITFIKCCYNILYLQHVYFSYFSIHSSTSCSFSSLVSICCLKNNSRAIWKSHKKKGIMGNILQWNLRSEAHTLYKIRIKKRPKFVLFKTKRQLQRRFNVKEILCNFSPAEGADPSLCNLTNRRHICLQVEMFRMASLEERACLWNGRVIFNCILYKYDSVWSSVSAYCLYYMCGVVEPHHRKVTFGSFCPAEGTVSERDVFLLTSCLRTI